MIATVVWGFVGLATLGMLMMSPMLFDAPGSEHNRYLWWIVWSLLATVLLCVASVVGGWIAFGVRAGRWMRVLLALLPLAGVAGVVAGFALLEMGCKGSFSCQ